MKGTEARLAAHLQHHHGVITRTELERLGVDARLAARKVRAGEWQRRGRDVYVALTAPRTPAQDLVAALAIVPSAAASHGAAAWLLGLLDAPPTKAEVTTTRQRGYETGEVIVHRTTRAIPTLRIHGFPCTTAGRTLVDLAATAGPEVVTPALDRALQRRQTAVPHLERALNTAEKGRPGAAALKAVLANRGMIGTPEPSVLESHMDRLLHRSGLPRATAQHRVEDGRYRFDYAWPDLGLAIEAKGYAWHSSPEALAADSRRERHTAAAGWTLLSFTWVEVLRRPAEVVAEIAAVHAQLAARSAS